MAKNLLSKICCFEKTLIPLLRLKPAYTLQTGIYSDLERATLLKQILHLPQNHMQNQHFLERYNELHQIEVKISRETVDPVTPAQLLKNFPTAFEHDIALLNPGEFKTSNDEHEIDGDPSALYIHHSAQVSRRAFFDTRKGAIVIDANAVVSPFSLLTGPAYIGPESQLDRVSFSNSRCGRNCRLGGEIADSIIGSYSNKHHEGFLGHSLVGDWVNLGALTTTSDLKNNYGEVKLQIAETQFASGVIKLGSIIGDFSKTSIGTMLNTGTIIDVGCLLYSPVSSAKYYPPFFWGGSEPDVYQFERFLHDIEAIMARRNRKPDMFYLSALKEIHPEARKA